MILLIINKKFITKPTKKINKKDRDNIIEIFSEDEQIEETNYANIRNANM